MSMLKTIKEKKYFLPKKKKNFPPPLKKKIPSRKFHTSSNLERKIWKFPNPVRRALLGKTAIKNIEHGNWVPTGIFDKIEVLKIPHFKPQNELNKKNQEKKKNHSKQSEEKEWERIEDERKRRSDILPDSDADFDHGPITEAENIYQEDSTYYRKHALYTK